MPVEIAAVDFPTSDQYRYLGLGDIPPLGREGTFPAPVTPSGNRPACLDDPPTALPPRFTETTGHSLGSVPLGQGIESIPWRMEQSLQQTDLVWADYLQPVAGSSLSFFHAEYHAVLLSTFVSFRIDRILYRLGFTSSKDGIGSRNDGRIDFTALYSSCQFTPSRRAEEATSRSLGRGARLYAALVMAASQ